MPSIINLNQSFSTPKANHTLNQLRLLLLLIILFLLTNFALLLSNCYIEDKTIFWSSSPRLLTIEIRVNDSSLEWKSKIKQTSIFARKWPNKNKKCTFIIQTTFLTTWHKFSAIPTYGRAIPLQFTQTWF